jgi:hypothetical protein
VVGKVAGLSGFIGLRGPVDCSLPSPSLVECSFKGTLPPYEVIEASVEVQVEAGAKSGEALEIATVGGETYACEEIGFNTGKYTSSVCSVEGTGNFEKRLSGKQLAAASAKVPLRISGAAVQFGTENYELNAYNENGSLDTQAGSHPFDLTTTFALNRTGTPPYQTALAKDLQFKLPPGLIGNPTPFPQCSDVDFFHFGALHNLCPNKTAVGVALVTVYEPGARLQPNPVDGGAGEIRFRRVRWVPRHLGHLGPDGRRLRGDGQRQKHLTGIHVPWQYRNILGGSGRPGARLPTRLELPQRRLLFQCRGRCVACVRSVG